MSELENDIIVSGTLLTGEKAVDDLAGVIVTTVCNTPGVTRLVKPWWRRFGNDGRSAIRISEEDGHSDVEVEVTVDLTVPIAVSYTHLTLPTTSRRCRSRWSPYH